MIILVGLGNPGSEYERQRHNVGFMAVDAIAQAYSFSEPRKKFKALIQEGILSGPSGKSKALIVKPQTYMNESGKSVGELVRFYKLSPEDIIVFHDELDLAPAKLRIKQGGGNAGHNGLRSIDAHIGNNFTRVRIGIGHPGSKAAVHNYVLGDFAKSDHDWLEDMLSGISKAAPHLVDNKEQGAARFQSEVAALLNPNPKHEKTKLKSDKTDKPVTGKSGQSASPKPDKQEQQSNPFADVLKKILPNSNKD